MQRFILIVFMTLLGLTTNGFTQLTHTFTQTAGNIDHGHGTATDVAVAPDGTIFLAYSQGLFAYTFEGSSFTRKAHINNDGYATRIVYDKGVVIAAFGGDGLYAYDYDGVSFTETAHIDDGGYGRDVAVGPDGTIFLADDEDGLRAYVYDGASLLNTAHIDDGGYARGVAVASDGTIFLANGDDGLRAYTYLYQA